jgi:hypothetical protein
MGRNPPVAGPWNTTVKMIRGGKVFAVKSTVNVRQEKEDKR